MEDTFLSPEEIVKARKKATFAKYNFNNVGAIPSEFCIAKDAQLKLLEMLDKVELLKHDHYGKQVYACEICNLINKYRGA